MSAVHPLNPDETIRLKTFLAQVAAAVEVQLEKVLPPEGQGVEAPLFACMRYSVFAGGKRFRPALLMGVYTMCGGREHERAALAGAALEMIHTYSLMQDDLPCMDDDTLRRGRPTAHVQFDEYIALLASDGLQTGAYEILANPEVHPDPAVRLELVRLYANASGARGMIEGQMLDMAWELSPPETPLTVHDVTRLSQLKTGRMLQAAVEAGAVLAGVSTMVRSTLKTFSEALGRAYQIYDDVLDVVGTAEQLGKTPGKDIRDSKTTFVTLLGTKGALVQAHAEANAAIAALSAFGPEADDLRLLARYCVTREK